MWWFCLLSNFGWGRVCLHVIFANQNWTDECVCVCVYTVDRAEYTPNHKQIKAYVSLFHHDVEDVSQKYSGNEFCHFIELTSRTEEQGWLNILKKLLSPFSSIIAEQNCQIILSSLDFPQIWCQTQKIKTKWLQNNTTKKACTDETNHPEVLLVRDAWLRFLNTRTESWRLNFLARAFSYEAAKKNVYL